MPTFCRHNRLIQNCPICSREQSVEPRPVLSSSAPKVNQPRPAPPRVARQRGGAARPAPGGVRVKRLARGVDDGYRTPLAPGLRSSADAERLAEELAFAAGRLSLLEQDPPALYAEVSHGDGDPEERTWLAFLIAYLAPLEGDDPFASIRRVRVPWRSIDELSLEGVETGPRTAHDPDRGLATVEAYRTWAERAGSQAAAFSGDGGWAPERRFERAFERLAFPGMHRDARYELLVSLGRLGLYDLRAGKLALGGENNVTVAAKRVFGIGDPLLLERRAADLAGACEVPLDALDLGLFNWDRPPAPASGDGAGGGRVTAGLGEYSEPDPGYLATARAALGL
jgi:hypothetical protein